MLILIEGLKKKMIEQNTHVDNHINLENGSPQLSQFHESEVVDNLPKDTVLEAALES